MSDSGDDDNMDLYESDTESDDIINEDDSSEDEDDESGGSEENDSIEEKLQKEEKKKTRKEVLAEKIFDRYKDRQGKQLYVRFPHKLPEDEEEFNKKIQTLFPQCLQGHKPRQKHARFCLIDFTSKEERDSAYKVLRSKAKKDGDLKGFVILLPRTDSQEFINKLVETKIESFEKRKARKQLQRQAKKQEAALKKNFTSTVVVHNLPGNATEGDLRKLFPNAIDVQMKSKKDKKTKSITIVAAVTLSSSFEARSAIRQKLELHGKQLRLRFDTQRKQHSPDDELAANYPGDFKQEERSIVEHQSNIKKQKKQNTKPNSKNAITSKKKNKNKLKS